MIIQNEKDTHNKRFKKQSSCKKIDALTQKLS